MTTPRIWIGTYANASGEGLYPLAYDRDRGFCLGDPCDIAANASFGAWSPRHGLHYLVNESSIGSVGAYRRQDGEWHKIAEVPSDGRAPCHVTLDPEGNRLAVANYASGSIALFNLDPHGLPVEPGTVWANAGSGPNPDRQEAPHLHCAQFSLDGQWLYAVDLGTDQVVRFPIDTTPTLQQAELAYAAPPGTGPRHLLFHPSGRAALLLSELASTLALLKAEGPELRVRVTSSTLPRDFAGDSLGGHLELNAAGDRAYVTNRGHDSIAVFAVDAETHALELLQYIASEGSSPRHLLLLEGERLMIAAHEKDGTISAFELASDGTLSATGNSCRVPGAVFLFREA
jgi:6-phosphogluconolactonase